MTRLRALLLSLAMPLFAASGVVHAAPPLTTNAPACHQSTAALGSHNPQHQPPAVDMMAMSCCLRFLPERGAAIAGPVERQDQVVFEWRQDRAEGLAPPPELGPPRGT